MKLRYTGQTPLALMGHGRSVEPDEEFDVSDDVAPTLLVRSDMEKVQAPPRAPKAKAPQPKPDETTLTN